MKNITLKYNLKSVCIGVFFCLFGIFLPSVLVPETFYVENFLAIYIDCGDIFYLLLSVCGIVLLNCLRALPFYLGTFMLAETLYVTYKGKNLFICNCIFTFVLLSLLYKITNTIQHLSLHFGYTSYAVIVFVLVLLYLNLFSVSIFDKILILTFIQLSLQWLDEIPALTRFGFGLGTVTMEIKKASVEMGDDKTLTIFVFVMIFIFLLSLVLQTRLLYQKHHLKTSSQERQKAMNALHASQIETLRLRTNSELQHLVHDLKSPLTTIQGLSSLLLMMEQDETLQEYLQKIDDSSNTMSSMISDILYEDKKE